VPYRTRGGDSITISRVAAWCCGNLLEELLGEWRAPKLRRLSEVSMLLSSDAREEPDEEGVRSEYLGLLFDREAFFKSTGRSKEFELLLKKKKRLVA
jgi:hypothetical protein